MYEDLQRNTVPAEKQNEDSYFEFKKGNGLKILFVGNSISLHSVKPEIGWNNKWGMAASSIDKDYIHVLMKKIDEFHKDVAVSLLQVADFERGFNKGFDFEREYKPARDFGADIIIMFFGANVSKEYDISENPEIRFADKYEELRLFLDKDKKAFVIHTEGFYLRPVVTKEKFEVCEKLGDVWVSLDDIPKRKDTHDLRFNHPNDKGMYEIAEKIWNSLKTKIV